MRRWPHLLLRVRLGAATTALLATGARQTDGVRITQVKPHQFVAHQVDGR